jgi:diguanylate cyclase (GGDEF)-like protein
MSPDTRKPTAISPNETAPLSRALDQSQQVQDKVEQAGVGLASVNAALKVEVAERVPLAKVESALNQSQAIEVKVQEAAAELVAVNEALALEIDERHHLEDKLSASNAALAQSRAREARSRDSALHDAVTGLPNLTLFNDRLRTALIQAQRHAWRLAVMFVDLDGFKAVNDTHGHAVGDRVLQLVGQRMQSNVRGSDTVSRRSGDEFLFLMLEAKDDSNVAALAAKIAQNIAQPCTIDGVELTVSASIGIAVYPEDGSSAEELLKNADAAMYASKRDRNGPALHGQRIGASPP